MRKLQLMGTQLVSECIIPSKELSWGSFCPSDSFCFYCLQEQFLSAAAWCKCHAEGARTCTRACEHSYTGMLRIWGGTWLFCTFWYPPPVSNKSVRVVCLSSVMSVCLTASGSSRTRGEEAYKCIYSCFKAIKPLLHTWYTFFSDRHEHFHSYLSRFKLSSCHRKQCPE